MMLKIIATAVVILFTPSLNVGSPITEGMDASRLDRIEYVVNQGIKYGAYPGASVVVGKNGVIIFEKGYGHTTYTDSNTVIPIHTMYDLASLTKVVSATTAIMYLYDRGLIKLDDKVSQYLPEFEGGAKNNVTIQHLLTHTSGLPSGRSLPSNAIYIARELVMKTSLRHSPGSHYEYSDLSMILLGMISEKITHMPLDEFTRDSIFTPLKMTNTMYTPDESFNDRIAPTLNVKGQVHDPMASALGGVAGNAGLFSTATDLAIFAQMMLNKGKVDSVQFLKPETVELFTKNITQDRALGWQTCARGSYGCGSLSKQAFGHTGYTGTSMWIDPTSDTFIIVLTNRVYAPKTSKSQSGIIATRTDIANIVQSALDENSNIVTHFKIDVANIVRRIKSRFKKHHKVAKKKKHH